MALESNFLLSIPDDQTSYVHRKRVYACGTNFPYKTLQIALQQFLRCDFAKF